MNTETLQIIDQSLQYSLITFLILLALFLLYSGWRLRQKKKRLDEYFQEQFEQKYRDELLPEAESARGPRYVGTSNQHRTLLHALVLAALLAVFSFFLYGFAPLPFVHNFATESTWNVTPLRLTALSYERFHEGFSLDGEVWNQTEEPLEGLQAVITVRDSEQEVLDRITAEVDPSPLPAGQAARFKVEYRENSPLIYGYQVEFLNADGATVPHLEGFDVR